MMKKAMKRNQNQKKIKLYRPKKQKASPCTQSPNRVKGWQESQQVARASAWQTSYKNFARKWRHISNQGSSSLPCHWRPAMVRFLHTFCVGQWWYLIVCSSSFQYIYSFLWCLFLIAVCLIELLLSSFSLLLLL